MNRGAPAPQQLPAPPPSAALLAAMADLAPVSTRRPARRVFAIAAIALLVTAAALLKVLGVRPDLRTLDAAPLLLFVLLGTVAFAASLVVALVPPRGQVIPSGATSVTVPVLLAAIVVPLALYLGTHLVGSGTVLEAPHLWRSTLACFVVGSAVAAIPATLGMLALRKVVPTGGWRTAFAVGAAAGALAGLALELHCSIADPAHITLGHGLAMVAPLLLLPLVTLLEERAR